MDTRQESCGWATLLQHLWWVPLAGASWLAVQGFNFMTRLSADSWAWCYGAGLLVAVVGAGMIGWAKWPLYLRRRFLTFGSGALPRRRRSAYRWGRWCVVLSVGLLLGLLLTAL